MPDLPKVNARTHIETVCVCPYCEAVEDIFDDVKDYFNDGPRATDCDIEIECSECKGAFIVENIEY